MKFWAIVYNEDKILTDTLFECKRLLSQKNYIKTLQEIAYILDIATPISLDAHFKQLEKFGRIKYLPRDFVEDVDFTSFTIEVVR